MSDASLALNLLNVLLLSITAGILIGCFLVFFAFKNHPARSMNFVIVMGAIFGLPFVLFRFLATALVIALSAIEMPLALVSSITIASYVLGIAAIPILAKWAGKKLYDIDEGWKFWLMKTALIFGSYIVITAFIKYVVIGAD